MKEGRKEAGEEDGKIRATGWSKFDNWNELPTPDAIIFPFCVYVVNGTLIKHHSRHKSHHPSSWGLRGLGVREHSEIQNLKWHRNEGRRKEEGGRRSAHGTKTDEVAGKLRGGGTYADRKQTAGGWKQTWGRMEKRMEVTPRGRRLPIPPTRPPAPSIWQTIHNYHVLRLLQLLWISPRGSIRWQSGTLRCSLVRRHSVSGGITEPSCCCAGIRVAYSTWRSVNLNDARFTVVSFTDTEVLNISLCVFQSSKFNSWLFLVHAL